jgi:hypothetical protein
VSVAEDSGTDGSSEPGEPPVVIAQLRRALDALAAKYGDVLTVGHFFDAD